MEKMNIKNLLDVKSKLDNQISKEVNSLLEQLAKKHEIKVESSNGSLTFEDSNSNIIYFFELFEKELKTNYDEIPDKKIILEVYSSKVFNYLDIEEGFIDENCLVLSQLKFSLREELFDVVFQINSAFDNKESLESLSSVRYDARKKE